MSYNCLAGKLLPRHNSGRFYFFAQKGVIHFQNSKKTADHTNSIVLRIPKKVNIFEIGSLEVYDRGEGVTQGLHSIASLHVLTYAG